MYLGKHAGMWGMYSWCVPGYILGDVGYILEMHPAVYAGVYGMYSGCTRVYTRVCRVYALQDVPGYVHGYV